MVIVGDADNTLGLVKIVCSRNRLVLDSRETSVIYIPGSLSRCAGGQFTLYLERKHRSHVHDSAHVSFHMQVRRRKAAWSGLLCNKTPH